MAENHYDGKGTNEAVQAQFSRRAERYRTSEVHARGEDLSWIVTEASLKGTERVLDVGTGAGHTAFALASGARTVMGVDLTEKMVESAASLAEEHGVVNVQFIVSDAVRLPFPSNHFDLITCRFAAHHFTAPDVAMAEMSRVLRPGGQILMVDHIAPDKPELDAYINHIDWLRDPSHVREWNVSEWLERFQTVGVMANVSREWDLHMEVSWWLEQSAPTEDHRRQIEQMFREADRITRDTFRIELGEDGYPVSFALKCVLMHGRKAD